MVELIYTNNTEYEYLVGTEVTFNQFKIGTVVVFDTFHTSNIQSILYEYTGNYVDVIVTTLNSRYIFRLGKTKW